MNKKEERMQKIAEIFKLWKKYVRGAQSDTFTAYLDYKKGYLILRLPIHPEDEFPINIFAQIQEYNIPCWIRAHELCITIWDATDNDN